MKLSSMPNNTHLLTMNMNKTLCYVKKIYFCVYIRVYLCEYSQYVVITVQYLVPCLFVSISCYSISRFLKRRMKQMRSYQIHRPSSINNKRPKKPKFQKKKSEIDELTETELPSLMKYLLQFLPLKINQIIY